MPAIPDSPPLLDAIITGLCAERGADRTICPTEAAKAFAAALGENETAWRTHLGAVRRAAVALAMAGRLVITRKGKPVDPENFRGVYRLGAPSSE